jgi:hypothetical protein
VELPLKPRTPSVLFVLIVCIKRAMLKKARKPHEAVFVMKETLLPHQKISGVIMRLVKAIIKIVEATLSKAATKVGIKTAHKAGEATAIDLSKAATKVKVGIKTVHKVGEATAIALSKAGTKVRVGIKTVPKAGVATAIALSKVVTKVKVGIKTAHKAGVVATAIGLLSKAGMVNVHKEAVTAVRQGVGASIVVGVALPHDACS